MPKRVKKEKEPKRSSPIVLAHDPGTWVTITEDAIEPVPGSLQYHVVESMRELGEGEYAHGYFDQSTPLFRFCAEYVEKHHTASGILQFRTALVRKFEDRNICVDEWTHIPGGGESSPVCVFFFGSSQRQFELKANAPDDSTIPRITFQTRNNSMLFINGAVFREQYKFRIPPADHDVGPLLMITFISKFA